jgi:hypothetical protein
MRHPLSQIVELQIYFILFQDDCPMEVEGCEDHPAAVTVAEPEVSVQGCESKSPAPVSTASTSETSSVVVPHTMTLADGVTDPAPRSISEVEMKVLQVSQTFLFLILTSLSFWGWGSHLLLVKDLSVLPDSSNYYN